MRKNMIFTLPLRIFQKAVRNTLCLPIMLSSFISVASVAQNIEQLPPKFGEFSLTDIPFSIPDLEESYIDATPVDLSDGILVGELGIDGGKKSMIMTLAQQIADNKHGKYDSLLIAHQDKLIFESYYKRGRVNLPHPQASTTKSYTALAVGRAVELGYLSMADLNKPIVSFFKSINVDNLTEGADEITLHQVMNMRSGITLSKANKDKLTENPQLQKGLKQLQTLLELSEPISKKSQTFEYKSTDTKITMHVLDVVVPGTADGFIKQELFGKMGISNYGWKKDVSGLPRGYNGASITSRDMLKVGMLIKNKGIWNGKQHISEAFIAKATSRFSYPELDWIPKEAEVEKLSYGYYMWRTDMIVEGKRMDCKFAWGGGGQYILTIEELDLTVVITAHDREDVTLVLAPKIILAAFVK
jgi:CubicO group peptidase (beta-lactamase class C family)